MLDSNRWGLEMGGGVLVNAQQLVFWQRKSPDL